MSEARPKRRRKPQPLRFSDLKVGDIVIHRRKAIGAVTPKRPLPVANDDPPDTIYFSTDHTTYAIVTDRWFDPVYGQSDESAGQMVGLRYWSPGEVEGHGSKWSHNLLGLARKGWHYATADQIADYHGQLERERRLREAVRDGEVKPISAVKA